MQGLPEAAVLELDALFDDDDAGAAEAPRSRQVGPWRVVTAAVEPMRCVFVSGAAALQLVLRDVAGAELVPAGGWLLLQSGGANVYWLPQPPALRDVDPQGRMRGEQAAVVETLALAGGQARLVCAAPPAGFESDLAVWRMPSAMAGVLREPGSLERQAAFLWGSHTALARLGDIGLHLIRGQVYENRWAWPFKRRVCSENDAHSIVVQLTGLHRATGQALPALLARQVVQAVVARIGGDGAFRHGVWTDGMESHYRLHCSAMHLLMDALAERPDDAAARAALHGAAAFLARQTSPVAGGVWFLHDDLEHSIESLRRAPFDWVDSQAFGKARSNMLVLNSHLDAIVALDRYAQVCADAQYAALVEQAREALRAVLGQRPAEGLYRMLFALVGLTFLPTPRAAALPAWQRALKRLCWKFVNPNLMRLKARLPRLVMPGGYIDRELTQRTLSHDYHAVNLMDLARYLRRFPAEPLVRQVLRDGLAMARDSGLVERWGEMHYQKYALGFWAEALYHACQLFSDPAYRQWLAEAMLLLEDLRLGLPPSLLGANAEAVPPAEQLPCPSPTDHRLRVANLGRRGSPELLVVNPTGAVLPLAWHRAPAEAVRFHAPGAAVDATAPHGVPARGWLWARAAD